MDKKRAKSSGKQPKNSIEDAFGLPLALVSAHDVAPPKDPNAPPFDSKRWNASQIRRRADKQAQELIDEYDAGTTRLVMALSDLTLGTLVTIGPHAGVSLGEAMAEMLNHQRHHLSDLQGALAS